MDAAAPRSPRKCSLPDWRQALNIVACAIFLFSSGITGADIAVRWGWAKQQIGQTSDVRPTAITPAGWAFSIWSLIFVLLVGLSLFQALPWRRQWSRRVLGWDWVLNAGVLEAAWPFLFANETADMIPSAVVIVLIIFTALRIYVRLDTGVAPLAGMPEVAVARLPWMLRPLAKTRPPISGWELVFGQFPISLYSGWLSVATTLNIAIALSPRGQLGTAGWTAEGWGIVMLFVASALAATLLITRTDFVYAAAVAWALGAIASKQRDPANPFGGITSIENVAQGLSYTLAALCVAAAVWRLVLWRAGRLRFKRESEVKDEPAAPATGAAAGSGVRSWGTRKGGVGEPILPGGGTGSPALTGAAPGEAVRLNPAYGVDPAAAAAPASPVVFAAVRVS